jgi:hypothetical protein
MSNAICFLIAAAIVAFIGIQAADIPPATHSGTQSYIRK